MIDLEPPGSPDRNSGTCTECGHENGKGFGVTVCTECGHRIEPDIRGLYPVFPQWRVPFVSDLLDRGLPLYPVLFVALIVLAILVFGPW